jgi:2-polyprenyl-6-methoxyphenol hydroxylase-like FAD-dependent oxidoreductase
MQQTVNASVTFDCTSVVGADGYHLQVAANPAFEPNQASELEDGNYFWRVAAMATAADGNRTTGPFGNPGAFTVDASASTNATEHNTVVYWSGEFGQNYTAQISRDPDFSDIVRTQEVTQNSLDLYGLSAGSYYIRLQLDGEHGSPAYTSAPRIFEIRPEERIIQRTWADTVK